MGVDECKILETIEPFGAFDTHEGLSHRIQDRFELYQ